jgi:hypothetical protein
MFQSLKTLEKTLYDLEKPIGLSAADIDEVLIWLEKYIRTVFSSGSLNKKGEELTVPLDAAFNIAIKLFSIIDKGSEGVDDKLSEELTKIKIRYLGY